MKDWAKPKVYLNIPSEKKTSSGDQIVWKFKRTSYKLRNVAITDQRAALGTDLAAGEITALLDKTIHWIQSFPYSALQNLDMKYWNIILKQQHFLWSGKSFFGFFFKSSFACCLNAPLSNKV